MEYSRNLKQTLNNRHRLLVDRCSHLYMSKLQDQISTNVLKIGIFLFGTFFIPGFVFAADLILQNPLGVTDPNILIGRIIKQVLGFVGTIALVMFIYGGLMWMLSMGDAGRVKKGRDTFIWATLGLIVIFSSYLIVNFIFDFLKG